MLFQVFSILAPLMLIVVAGYCYAKVVSPDMQAANKMNMELLIPALIFSVMASEDFQIGRYVGLSAAVVGVVLTSGFAGYVISRVFGFQWRTFVMPMMFANWGNLGIPLIVFTFGDDALNAAVIMFVVGNLIHFTLGVGLLSGKFHPFDLFKTPIVVAVLAGLAFSIGGISLPEFIIKPMNMLGQASIPIMLVALGVRLTQVHWNDLQISLVVAIAAPAVGLLAAWGFGSLLQLDDLQLKQLLLFGALPPAVLNFMLAEQYNQEPEKVASIVMVSNIMAAGVYSLLLYFVIR